MRYCNFPAFDARKEQLLSDGWETVVSPADLDRELGFEPTFFLTKVSAEFTRKALRRDIEALMTCDAIYMMEDWEMSQGATIEHGVARGIGLDVIYESPRDTAKYVYSWATAVVR